MGGACSKKDDQALPPGGSSMLYCTYYYSNIFFEEGGQVVTEMQKLIKLIDSQLKDSASILHLCVAIATNEDNNFDKFNQETKNTLQVS